MWLKVFCHFFIGEGDVSFIRTSVLAPMSTQVCLHTLHEARTLVGWGGQALLQEGIRKRPIPEDRWHLRLWAHPGGKPALSECWTVLGVPGAGL